MEKKFGALLLFIIALSILARIFFFLSPTYYAEENIGIASSIAIRADGLRPYADFINSHPPFHLYLLSTFSEISGLNDPIFSAKLLSLILSAGMLVLIYMAGGLVPASIFSASLPFFHWYSLSIPLLPTAFFLLAFHVIQKRQGTQELSSLKAVVAVGAIFSELSAIPALILLTILFGTPGARGKWKLAIKALFGTALLGFAFFILAGKPFLENVILGQLEGRAPIILLDLAGSFARNSGEILISIVSASFPLVALASISRDRKGLLFFAISLALFAIFLPNLSNNTLQFLVPFLALSAGKAIEARPGAFAIIPAILAFSAILAISAEGGLIGRTHELERMSSLLINGKRGISDPTIWGSPEASLLSVKTGIPVAENFFESTPTMLGILSSKNFTDFPRPTFLVVSEYYGAIDFYGEKLEYEEISSNREPAVGTIKVYKRKE